VILSPGLNVRTVHVPMMIYKVIHRWFVYKVKEGRYIKM